LCMISLSNSRVGNNSASKSNLIVNANRVSNSVNQLKTPFTTFRP